MVYFKNMIYYNIVSDNYKKVGGKMEKKIGIFLTILLFIAGIAVALPAPRFDQVVDFEISIKELDKLIKAGQSSKVADKYLILNGSLSGYTVTDTEKNSYTVELELINGEWEGVSDVFIYRCKVIFSGEEYRVKFPARRRSVPGPGEIALNSGLIVVAKLKEIKDGIAVLDGYYLREYK